MTISAGTLLWRVHSQTFSGDAFRPVSPVPADNTDPNFEGGRFDATAAYGYPYFYAGFRQTTALAERFLRGLEFKAGGYRTLLRKTVLKTAISAVEVTRDLDLISLISATDLAAVGQDEWLVDVDGDAAYGQTRRWAHWLHKNTGRCGLAWQSKRDRPYTAVILFGDRCTGSVNLVPGSTQKLDDAAGAAYLNAMLVPYRVRITPPR
ncbi:RES family NAD+ phosphorylase [Paractinoplanes rishiriensis]|uniref:RES family NAD+ phosphorylase n=1 Tax=Paractinoplanes rishiriensis TaxID=1050105 RepID=UPI0019452CD5|nr:RES family NAD+ phosphorylase [Actinoplanes rishiriensis]